jgi:methylmalonyl-CoA mutase, C-terminal domain
VIKVLVAKLGLDGHDVGAKLVARALRDAGMEVVYTGVRQTPANVVQAALEEDVDVLGISILSGAHMALIPDVLTLLRDNGAEDVLVIAGGVLPPDDVKALKARGLTEAFGQGASTHDIVAFIERHARRDSRAGD